MGGPQDTIPPAILRSTPAADELNFTGTQITVQFNELIALNNPKEEIIVVPSIGKKSKYTVKGDRLIIEPELPWKENTTYVINFREGVEDLTEGNSLPDKQLAFSTGNDLDTLQISGTIKEALKETIPDKITVAIYTADTFNIFSHTPEYFTRSNKEGQFKITNLKPGTYRIYAFDDKNKNLKAESRNERFGFLAKPIVLDSNATAAPIALVSVDSRQLKISSVRNQSTVNTIRLNKSVTTYSIKAEVPLLSVFNANQSEVIVHYPELEKDSIITAFTATDSIDSSLDTTFYIRKDNRAKIKETFRFAMEDVTYKKDSKRLHFNVTFNKPLRNINSDSLYIQIDTTTAEPLVPEKIDYDTIRNKLTYDFTLPLDSLPPAAKLKAGKGYLTSIDSDSSSILIQDIKQITLESTATLLIELQTKEPNFIVQVLNSTGRILQTKTNQLKPVFRDLTPETIKVRIIVDKNGNKKWDTANFNANTEPEQVIYYQNIEKKYDVPLRANWEVGPLIIKF
jgi:uncharacterized protein (DUF2141 family)